MCFCIQNNIFIIPEEDVSFTLTQPFQHSLSGTLLIQCCNFTLKLPLLRVQLVNLLINFRTHTALVLE